jgi:hypothetical protein
MDQMVKEFYLKRKWHREALLEKIEKKEEEMRNKKMTAQEEKGYITELSKMKDTFEKLDRLEEINNEYMLLQNGLKGLNVKGLSAELASKFAKLKELSEEYGNFKKQKISLSEEQPKIKNVTDEEAKLIKKKEQI